jgi:hypothetical protein
MMNKTQTIARFGATLALALTLVVSTAPTLAFATDGDHDDGHEDGYYDPSAAPFVLTTVNGGVQTAATGTEFGLGTGAAASGEPGLAIGAGGTDLGAAAADLGIGVPAAALGAP